MSEVVGAFSLEKPTLALEREQHEAWRREKNRFQQLSVWLHIMSSNSTDGKIVSSGQDKNLLQKTKGISFFCW